uniref:Uncharacterized protein n=1 Tax=Anser brachyrhynchus TaxID=132585 RepID=A0A8B9CQG2_9AVES
MRSATEMHSKARLWQARTLSAAPPGSAPPAAAPPPLAAMRAPRERRSQSQARSSPSWQATKPTDNNRPWRRRRRPDDRPPLPSALPALAGAPRAGPQ